MPLLGETEKIARKLLPIIYVLDTSGSMEGSRIAAVNAAMNETMEVLKDVSSKNPTAELKIAVLQFSSGPQWVTENLVFMEDFYWNDLKAGGLTDFGSALNELNNKLSREQFLVSEVGFKAPVIIFMSDGEPTDDYESALNKIKSNNKWFQVATKIAIAVGDDANIQVLQKIAGNKEAVIKVDDLETLKKLIRVVSVTATMIGSKSRTEDDQTDKVISKIEQDMGDEIQVPSDPEISQENNTQDSSDSLSGQDVDDSDPWGNGVWD
jgi:hypothetical protein epulo_01596